LQVPRDREGRFHTQVFERYSRYEPQVADGLTEMFVAGVSTHKVGEVAETLMGVAPSASAISRLNGDLEQQFTAWRQRRLQDHWRILYLDGIHFSVRHGDQADSIMILTALGVDLVGNKEVLALFSATPRQRCLLHKQRNVLNAVPRRVRHEVETELAGIWVQPTKEAALTQLAAFKAKYDKLYSEAITSLSEEEDKTLTFYGFPQTMHRYIRTTNAIESLFSNVRQRTDQIDVFTTEMSCLTIVWATIEGITLRKVPVE
jgi:putative transposase